jgi:hypothetical protein
MDALIIDACSSCHSYNAVSGAFSSDGVWGSSSGPTNPCFQASAIPTGAVLTDSHSTEDDEFVAKKKLKLFQQLL